MDEDLVWVKYKHSYAHGTDEDWKWRLYPSRWSRKEIKQDLYKEYEYSDKYRGVKFYRVSDKNVPDHVWATEILREEARAEAAAKKVAELRFRLRTALGKVDLNAAIKRENGRHMRKVRARMKKLFPADWGI